MIPSQHEIEVAATSLALDGDNLTIADVIAAIESAETPERFQIEITEDGKERIRRSRQAVETLIETGAVVYGITTGFGNFRDRIIPADQVAQLQRNLIMSHAVGTGRPLDPGIVRGMMLIRANALVKGFSGIRLEVVETLLRMINAGVYPIIPSQGSVGASGDLAPLAHMVLVIIGEGEACYKGEKLTGAEAMQRAGIPTMELAAKEGIALINGTSTMAAIGAYAVHQADLLTRTADIAGALSLEALNGTRDAFDPRIHAARPHPYQEACANNIRRLLEGSEHTRSFDPKRVQDAYSLRCMPQVHGAVRDTVVHVREIVEREINSAVDNPLLFWEGDEPRALSGGNFHGEPIALAMDALTTAVAELGNISERRTARLIDPTLNEGLPAFLIDAGGLNSGFMLPQYTAAALASENKVLAHPASVDTIPTSANTEDHVSMGTIAARQAKEVAENVAAILAIEIISAAQAVDFRIKDCEKPLGRGTQAAFDTIRKHMPFIETDMVLYPYIQDMKEVVMRGGLVGSVEAALTQQ